MPIKKTKEIDGLTYRRKVDYFSRHLANKMAKRLREMGWLVRVIRELTPKDRKKYSKYMFVLWIRRG